MHTSVCVETWAMRAASGNLHWQCTCVNASVHCSFFVTLICYGVQLCDFWMRLPGSRSVG